MNPTAHPDPKHATLHAFESLEFRIGTIKAVKDHPKADDYILLIDLGPVEQDLQVIAHLKSAYSIEQLVGKQVCVIVNTPEQEVLGFENQGLLLTTTQNGETVLLQPDREVHAGTKVYGLMDKTVAHKSEIGR